MKKNLLLVALCAIVFGLTGCGTSSLNSIPDEYTGSYLGWKTGWREPPGASDYKYYYVYKLEKTKFLRKVCLLSAGTNINLEDLSNCNFNDGKTDVNFKTYEFQIENISKVEDDISFTYKEKDKNVTCTFTSKEDFSCKYENGSLPVESGKKLK